MRDIKFRYVYKHRETGKLSINVKTLDEIEDEDSWQGASPWELIGRDEFIGSLDKNGREIYEGDICKAYKPNSYLDGNYAVVWDDKRGRWAYDNTFLDRMYQVGSANNLACEIISTIYENPELLKPKAKNK